MAAHKWDGKEDWTVKTILSPKEKAALRLAAVREGRPQRDILHDALVEYLRRTSPSQIGSVAVSEENVVEEHLGEA